jgi:hypothetical protein
MPQSSTLSIGMDVQKDARSYAIPGSSAPTLSEKCHPFFRPWHKKGCKEDRVTRMRLHNLSPSTILASNTSLESFFRLCLPRECWQRPVRRFEQPTPSCTPGPLVLQ